LSFVKDGNETFYNFFSLSVTKFVFVVFAALSAVNNVLLRRFTNIRSQLNFLALLDLFLLLLFQFIFGDLFQVGVEFVGSIRYNKEDNEEYKGNNCLPDFNFSRGAELEDKEHPDVSK
jgi:hypothetical protein